MDIKDRYDSLFQWYGDKYAFDWQALKAQAKAESNMDSTAVSPVGAKGLTQFMDSTWVQWQTGEKKLGDVIRLDPFNPEWSIRAQAGYMAWLKSQTQGELYDALISYNWGLGNYRKWKIGLKPRLPDETKNYIKRIYGILGWSVPEKVLL
jgi:soluble lytic murein transglycosylase-like protein